MQANILSLKQPYYFNCRERMGKMSVQFREAIPSDLEGLLALYTQLNDNTMPAIDERVLTVWQRLLRQEHIHTLVAEEDGRLLSTVSVTVIDSLTHGQRPYALVEYVVTDREHRGCGLAFSLLELAKQIAGEAGCYKIMLVTGHNEPGVHRLYQRAGHRSEGKTAYTQSL